MSTVSDPVLFSFRTAGEIVAGPNSVQSLAQIIPRLRPSHIALITGTGLGGLPTTAGLTRIIETAGIPFLLFDEVESDPSDESVDTLTAKVKAAGCDLVIGIGGGSALDAAKIVAVQLTSGVPSAQLVGIDKVPSPGTPTILIPTTAGTGSEVTPNAIVTVKKTRMKSGIVSRYLLPAYAILDPVLTVGLPAALTASTGMDALIHSLESFISRKANTMSDAFALHSMTLIDGSIENAFADGGDLHARFDMLVGASLGGMALTAAGTAAVHALSYPLGGRFGVPHGVANSMLLVPVMEFNADACTSRLAVAAEAFRHGRVDRRDRHSAESLLERLRELVVNLKIPRHLAQFGVQESDLDDLSSAAMQVTRLLANNPKPLGEAAIRDIYASIL